MTDFSKYKDDFILMTEAGFIAVNQGDEDAANKLFRAAKLIEPKNSLADVGLGYIHLMKLELKQACSTFDEVLKHEPDNEMAKTFLGLCLCFSHDQIPQGEKLLTEAAKDAKDPMVKSLADSAINFTEDFIKKPPSPIEMQKPKGE